MNSGVTSRTRIHSSYEHVCATEGREVETIFNVEKQWECKCGFLEPSTGGRKLKTWNSRRIIPTTRIVSRTINCCCR